MMWNYDCPACHRPITVDWRLREAETICRMCDRNHYPPTPSEDRYAYVDEEKWPPEMGMAVVALRGTICSVPGCYGEHSTFVFRQLPAQGGRTSVDNLMPVCARHASSKGNRNYDEWMAAMRQEEAARKKAEPTFEVTITSRPAETDMPSPDFAPLPGLLLPLAAARPVQPARTQDPGAKALAELKFAVPFLRGPTGKVVFSYDWEMKKSGRCLVFLLAWPRGEEPDIAPLGSPKFAGFSIAKDHLGVKDEKGNAELELTLPATPGGRWTAAVAILDEGCDFRFGEYALAATS